MKGSDAGIVNKGIVLADGRESDGTMLPGQFGISREVYVPIFENGIIHYTIMEIVATSDFDSGWAVKALPIQTFPTTTGPSAVNLMAIDGLETQKRPNPGFQTQHADPAGNGGKANME
ncbi:hypothetical protein B7494_g3069 [Chlorociboria aeruginascens]|nr:hypothetical protein B7494_g3069 [Chlorociboria aeruginascens]